VICSVCNEGIRNTDDTGRLKITRGVEYEPGSFIYGT